MSVQPAVIAFIYRMLRRWTERPIKGQPPPNCILVLQYMLPLGACVHATPLLEALHQGLPDLPVYVATRALGAEVLQHNPYIAGLLLTGDVFTDFRGTGKTLREGLRTRGLRPAWIVMDASNRRSKIALMGALYGRAPLAGFSLAKPLQRVALEPDPAKSMIANNLKIAAALGAPSKLREPRVFVSQEDIVSTNALFAEVNVRGRPVAIFATQPSGGQPTEWRDACWKTVMRHVSAAGYLPMFVGTGSQAAAIERLCNISDVPTVSLAGRTSVCVLAAVLASADVCISIDTGTLHVARATGVPVVALAPTFQSPLEWLPLDLPTARVLRGEGTGPVRPDYRLDEIASADVIAAFDELLDVYPPQPQRREARLKAMLSPVDHLAHG